MRAVYIAAGRPCRCGRRLRRAPAHRTRASPRAPRYLASPLDLRYRVRRKRFEVPPRLQEVEVRVLRFDAEEETVARGELEPGHIEERVVWRRQAVQREQAEDREERSAEDR